jgi:hypothetical protein
VRSFPLRGDRKRDISSRGGTSIACPSVCARDWEVGALFRSADQHCTSPTTADPRSLAPIPDRGDVLPSEGNSPSRRS